MAEVFDNQSAVVFRVSQERRSSGDWIPLRAMAMSDLGQPSQPLACHRIHMRRWAFWIALIDGGIAAIIMMLAVFLRFGEVEPTASGIPYGILPLIVPPVWVAALWLGGSYDIRCLPSGTDEYRRVVNASIWVLGCVGFTAFALQANISRAIVALAFPAITLATGVGRALARALLRAQLRSGSTIHRTAVIGAPEPGASLVRYMRQAPHLGFTVVRVYTSAKLPQDEVSPPREMPSANVTGPEELIAQLRSVEADTIAVADASSFGSDELRRLSWALEGSGIALLVAPPLTDVAGPRIVVRPAQGLPLLEIEEPEFRGAHRVVKGVLDRTLGVLLLAAFAPLLIAVAAAIKISDRGPIIYRQPRVGIHGATFRIWKFRTMTLDAEKQHAALLESSGHDGVLFKLTNDPRVTRVGKVLRRFSLDELPQLVNVVTGSMSLVGPRPQRPFEVALYTEDHRRRLLVKPGMTGLWQVSGRNNLSWEEAVQLDLHYVENWSITGDMMILAKTISAVWRPSGAY